MRKSLLFIQLLISPYYRTPHSHCPPLLLTVFHNPPQVVLREDLPLLRYRFLPPSPLPTMKRPPPHSPLPIMKRPPFRNINHLSTLSSLRVLAPRSRHYRTKQKPRRNYFQWLDRRGSRRSTPLSTRQSRREGKVSRTRLSLPRTNLLQARRRDSECLGLPQREEQCPPNPTTQKQGATLPKIVKARSPEPQQASRRRPRKLNLNLSHPPPNPFPLSPLSSSPNQYLKRVSFRPNHQNLRGTSIRLLRWEEI